MRVCVMLMIIGWFALCVAQLLTGTWLVAMTALFVVSFGAAAVRFVWAGGLDDFREDGDR